MNNEDNEIDIIEDEEIIANMMIVVFSVIFSSLLIIIGLVFGIIKVVIK